MISALSSGNVRISMVCAAPFLCGSVLTAAVPTGAIAGSSFTRIPHSAEPTVIDGASQEARDCPAPISPSERFTAASVVSLATVGPHGRSPVVATGAPALVPAVTAVALALPPGRRGCRR